MAARNSKTIPAKSGLKKNTPSVQMHVLSVNIEEVVDIDVCVPSNLPQNSNHILESEEEDDNVDNRDDITEIVQPEEEDESKLSQYQFYIQVTNKHLWRARKPVPEMDFTHLRFLQKKSTN